MKAYFMTCFMENTQKNILLSSKLCGSGSMQCCETGALNHLADNDFKPGESNTFEGDFIGTCDGFDLGESSTINLNNAIEIWHEGKLDNFYKMKTRRS